MGLHAYAERFVNAGLAAFVFDYRSFGGSDGEPRQWVSPSRHVADWRAAVAYVRSELADAVDGDRMCLWGTSFAGGHVLVLAADTPGIVAVVSQVPHLNARAATLASIRRRGIARSLLVLALGAADAAKAALGLGAPIYLPLVGPPGSLAFMQLDDFETSEYFSKHPAVYQGGWTNAARASLSWELFTQRYSPGACAPAVPCPVMFVAASTDSLCPVEQVKAAAAAAPKGTLLLRECTHFELYRGELFEGLIDKQAAFLAHAAGLPIPAEDCHRRAIDDDVVLGSRSTAATKGSRQRARGHDVAATADQDAA